MRILKKWPNLRILKKYHDQQFILRKSAGSQLFASFLVTYEIGREIGKFLKILKKWPILRILKKWPILQISKLMANFANSKKYRDQQFILRKSAGNQLFAALLVKFANSEINGKFCKF